MTGEELNATDVSEHGLAGDRAFALSDASTGKVASAKEPRKWSRLFDAGLRSPLSRRTTTFRRFGSRFRTERSSRAARTTSISPCRSSPAARSSLRRAAPEQPSLEEYWPDIEGLALHGTVTDEAMPEGTFFNLAAVHPVDDGHQRSPWRALPGRALRSQALSPEHRGRDLPEGGFPESAWVDRTVAIGADVRLSVNGPSPRCVMTTPPQGDLPKDPCILRTAAKHNEANVGVYASVLRGGTVPRGDRMRSV